MVEITVTAVKELDLRKLAKFMYDARKNTVFDTKSRTLEHLYESRKKITSDENIIFTAYANDALGFSWSEIMYYLVNTELDNGILHGM